MWQLLQKFLRIVRGDEQIFKALGESVWVLGSHQQPIFWIARAYERIPVSVLLICTFFDTADLLKGKEKTIVNMTRDEMDPNPLIGDEKSGPGLISQDDYKGWMEIVKKLTLKWT